MPQRILVGTCSWADKTLVDCGRFYPPRLKTAEERLRFYAGQFPLVEVDSSYYRLPAERNAALWVERGLSPAERFDWRYSEEELREWVPRIERMAREAGEVHLLMNNCREDKAVLGARQLQLLLHLPSRDGEAGR